MIVTLFVFDFNNFYLLLAIEINVTELCHYIVFLHDVQCVKVVLIPTDLLEALGKN